MSSRSSHALMLAAAMLAAAAPARAQEPTPDHPAPEDDPRRGPRLEYTRGPAECLPEDQFRNEVAISARDGIDHLHATSPDVVRVWFEKIPGGFRGTVVYTDTTGEKDPPQVHTADHCHITARWVADTIARLLPRPPAPSCPACPAPSCPACPAPSCPPCRACGTSPPASSVPPPPPPWPMDLSVGVSAYVLMSAFLSANVAPGVGIVGDARGEIFGIGGEVRFVLPSVVYAREPIPGATSTRPEQFDVSQLSALLVPCARYKYFMGCGVAQIGGLFYQTSAKLLSSFSYSFGPRIGFDVPFAERFAVFGFGEVLFAPSPGGIQFTLPPPDHPDASPSNTQWGPSVASAFFGAGLSVRFK